MFFELEQVGSTSVFIFIEFDFFGVPFWTCGAARSHRTNVQFILRCPEDPLERLGITLCIFSFSYNVGMLFGVILWGGRRGVGWWKDGGWRVRCGGWGGEGAVWN